MKKILIPVIVLAAGIALYFLSSFLFPVWGERVVVPVMILCLIAAAISAAWLAVSIVKMSKSKRR